MLRKIKFKIINYRKNSKLRTIFFVKIMSKRKRTFFCFYKNINTIATIVYFLIKTTIVRNGKLYIKNFFFKKTMNVFFHISTFVYDNFSSLNNVISKIFAKFLTLMFFFCIKCNKLSSLNDILQRI